MSAPAAAGNWTERIRSGLHNLASRRGAALMQLPPGCQRDDSRLG